MNSKEIKYHLFVSYSRKDLSQVQPIVDELTRRGVKAWQDLSGVDYGTTFPNEIAKAIDESACMLFVCSPNALAAPYCQKELDYARRNDKDIFVILLDGVMPKRGWFSLMYSNINCVNFTKEEQRVKFYKDMEELAEKIKISESDPTGTPPPPQPPLPYCEKLVKYSIWAQTVLLVALIAVFLDPFFFGTISRSAHLRTADGLLILTLAGMIWSTWTIKKYQFCKWSFLLWDVLAIALLLYLSTHYYDIYTAHGYTKGDLVYLNLRYLGYCCRTNVPLVAGVFGTLYVVHNLCIHAVMNSQTLWRKLRR